MLNGRARLAVGVVLTLALHAPRGVAAQQFATDDAIVAERRSCQLEAWYGAAASWLLPACRLAPPLQLSVGVGSVAHGGHRHTEYVLQAKHLLRALTPNGVGVGVVGGIGFDPLSPAAGNVEGVFAYVPVSVSLRDDRFVLHANLGWHLDRAAGDDAASTGSYTPTWAGRADAALGERVTLIAELFGAGDAPPELQVGVRSTLVRDRLQVDVSWGGHTDSAQRGAGWTVGAAWTPARRF